MQIKTTRIFLYTHTVQFYLNSDNSKCWEGCRTIGILIHFCWEYKITQVLWKTVWLFLIQWNIHLQCDPVFPLANISPKKVKTCFHTKICIWMFIEALLIITPNWKAKQMSLSGWMNKQTILLINKKWTVYTAI